VWLPGQEAYREISSCSDFEDFQGPASEDPLPAGKGEKPRLCHTLNGSGLAIGRTWLALLEQHQQRDGSVRIPQALQPYSAATASVRPVPGDDAPRRVGDERLTRAPAHR